jgi:hypothetical protein
MNGYVYTFIIIDYSFRVSDTKYLTDLSQQHTSNPSHKEKSTINGDLEMLMKPRSLDDDDGIVYQPEDDTDPLPAVVTPEGKQNTAWGPAEAG